MIDGFEKQRKSRIRIIYACTVHSVSDTRLLTYTPNSNSNSRVIGLWKLLLSDSHPELSVGLRMLTYSTVATCQSLLPAPVNCIASFGLRQLGESVIAYCSK